MNIVVLLKQVPKNALVKMNSDNTINRKSIVGVINSYDYNAIEEALRLRDAYGGKVTVVSLGTMKAKKLLKSALALGVDEAVLLSDDKFAGSDTYATANVLSSYLKNFISADLILCGKQTYDGSTAQIPSQIAAMLEYDLLTNVVKCEMENGMFVCEQEVEKYNIQYHLSMPAVVSVNNKINVPRIATLDGIKRAAEKEIKVINLEELSVDENSIGLKGSLTKVIQVINFGGHSNRKKQILSTNIDNYQKIAMEIEQELADCTELENQTRKVQLSNTTEKTIAVFCEMENGKLLKESVQCLNQGCQLAEELDTCLIAFTVVEKKYAINHAFLDLSQYGVKENHVITRPDETLLKGKITAEHIVPIIESLQKKPQIFILPGTIYGREIAPYLAGKLKCGLTADCISLRIDKDTKKMLQQRPAFGGKVNAVIETINSIIQMATLKPNVFNDNYVVEGVRCHTIIHDIEYKSDDYGNVTKVEECVDFEKNVIIGLGKGIGGKDNFDRVVEYCNLHNFGYCVTRDLVDMGYADYKYQVGLTGAIVNPKIYVAIGISGASEHVIGIANSRLVIAVNKDIQAPIFKYCDFGLVIQSEDILNLLEEIGKK